MANKINILLLDTGNEWGGGTNSMFELLKRIDRSVFNVLPVFYHNYSFGNSDLKARLKDIGYELAIINPPVDTFAYKLSKEIVRAVFFWNGSVRAKAIAAVNFYFKNTPSGKKIADFIADKSIDLIYLNNQPSTNMEGYVAAILSGKPLIQHCRIVPSLSGRDVRIINRNASKIICVSWGVEKVLRLHGVVPNLLTVVPNGVDCNTLPEKKETIEEGSEAPVTIGVVGSLIKRKRNEVILDAAAILRKSRKNIKVVFVGEGPDELHLIDQAKKLGVEDVVDFVGFQKKPLDWMRSFDILVSASRAEGLPRVILEAMGIGLPVVASDIPGTNDLVEDEETGYLFDLDNSSRLAEQLSRLIENKKLRQIMGNAGRRRVAEKFSIDQYVSGVQKIFKDCVGV